MVLRLFHTFRVGFAACVAAAALLLLVGCSNNPKYTDYHAFIQEPRMPASTTPYLIGPPDVMEFRSTRVREITSYRETVSPDGYVNVPLLGKIFVAGRTVESVQQELEQRASFYYQDADINARVTRYASKRIFVFGEVGNSGPYIYDGSNTVLNTLAKAAPTNRADPAAIQIVRPDENGELRSRMTINLDHMVRTGDTTLNAVLQDGDIVYVPPSGIGKATIAFEQLLMPLQPLSNLVNGPANINNAVTGERGYGDAPGE
ncbi:MAG: polysaccharide biosynthesis/export family protein [Phycisphaeraceae bacterium]